MARKIKRFFVFLFLSLFFSIFSGRLKVSVLPRGKQIKSATAVKMAWAGQCCPKKICTAANGTDYCCDASGNPGTGSGGGSGGSTDKNYEERD